MKYKKSKMDVNVKLVPIRPTRYIEGNKEYVRYVNPDYPDIPDMKETIEEYKKKNIPSIKVEASDEEILKKYLQSIFRQSFDDDAEFYGRLALHEFQYLYARDICQKLGFMAGSRITDKGIEFLKYLQQKEIQIKQNKINKWLVIATIVLAIGTIFQVLILLLK